MAVNGAPVRTKEEETLNRIREINDIETHLKFKKDSFYFNVEDDEYKFRCGRKYEPNEYERDHYDTPNDNIPSDLDRRPFFLFHGKPSFMINYHYIWVRKPQEFKPKPNLGIVQSILHNSKVVSNVNKTKEEIREQAKEILSMIRKYSYPSCILYQEQLTPDEKKEIIQDEFKFIKRRIEGKFTDIKLIQIPRIIYDIYNIIYRQKDEMRDIHIDVDSPTYSSFKYKIETETNRLIDHIIFMNDEFVYFLYQNELMLKLFDNNSTDIYLSIFEKLFDILTKQKEMKNYLVKPVGLRRSPTDTVDKILKIETKNNYKSTRRFKSILFQILLIELGFIYDIETDKYNLNNRSDVMILYRSFTGNILSTLKKNADATIIPQSNSFNTSMLNALINDVGANTFYYSSPGCHKHFYLIKKHFYNDASQEANLFFIPPIHPFLLLYTDGEHWHARSKVSNSTVPIMGTVGGLYGLRPVPDFLISNLNSRELEEYIKLYVKQIGKPVVDQFYKKYLKYKKKYSLLKADLFLRNH
jgi:hypothetical protein